MLTSPPSEDLNERQLRFVEAYVETANAGQAAIAAGYEPRSARNQGCRLLGMPRVREAVDRRRAEVFAHIGVTPERTVMEVARLAFSDVRKIMTWGPAVACKDIETGEVTISNGVALTSADELDDDAAACISEVRNTRDGISVKLHDKGAALEKLLRLQGLQAPTKVEHSGTVAHTVTLSKADLARRIVKIIGQGLAEKRAGKAA